MRKLQTCEMVSINDLIDKYRLPPFSGELGIGIQFFGVNFQGNLSGACSVKEIGRLIKKYGTRLPVADITDTTLANNLTKRIENISKSVNDIRRRNDSPERLVYSGKNGETNINSLLIDVLRFRNINNSAYLNSLGVIDILKKYHEIIHKCQTNYFDSRTHEKWKSHVFSRLRMFEQIISPDWTPPNSFSENELIDLNDNNFKIVIVSKKDKKRENHRIEECLVSAPLKLDQIKFIIVERNNLRKLEYLLSKLDCISKELLILA